MEECKMKMSVYDFLLLSTKRKRRIIKGYTNSIILEQQEKEELKNTAQRLGCSVDYLQAKRNGIVLRDDLSGL